MSGLLPEQFADLAPYCSKWLVANSQERNALRITATMDEINAFYNSVLPRAPEILDHLRVLQLGALDSRNENLLKLMLAFAEIGPCVEWFGAPRVVDGCDEAIFPLVRAIDDVAAQSG